MGIKNTEGQINGQAVVVCMSVGHANRLAQFAQKMALDAEELDLNEVQVTGKTVTLSICYGYVAGGWRSDVNKWLQKVAAKAEVRVTTVDTAKMSRRSRPRLNW